MKYYKRRPSWQPSFLELKSQIKDKYLFIGLFSSVFIFQLIWIQIHSKQEVALGQSDCSIFMSIRFDQSDCRISKISVKNLNCFHRIFSYIQEVYFLTVTSCIVFTEFSLHTGSVLTNCHFLSKVVLDVAFWICTHSTQKCHFWHEML